MTTIQPPVTAAPTVSLQTSLRLTPTAFVASLMTFELAGFSFWEFPFSLQYLGSRPIKPHHIVPSLHDWKAIGNLVAAATELDSDRAVPVFLCCNVVERVCVVVVLYEVSVSVINTD